MKKHNRTIMKIILPIVLLAFLVSCQQSPKMKISGDLEIGVEQFGNLQKKTPKSFEIQLDSNAFVLGVVNQKTVDVVVKLFNEANEEIGSFDGPATGPERFSFSVNKTGAYRLEVSPFQDKSGEYSIQIDKVEPIASDPAKRVDQLLAFYSNNEPGAVIGVIENGEMTFSKAYGKANITHNLDFKLNTPTNIGSVSKQFTAFAILLLEQQGLLSLDDDVRIHIPEFPDFGEVITLRNLLTHTNGLREVYNLLPISGWSGEDKLLRSEILNTLLRQKELQASPGEEFNYNNSAFIILAAIVERKTDSKFPDWMKKNVFEPLGMKDSYVRADPSQIIPNASQGYSQGENGLVESGDLYAAYGAGGIYTTPLDLSKWLNNFNDPQVGGKEIIEKLVTPGILKNGDTLPYALGIGVRERKGLKMYAHGGADIAHRAYLLYYPEINSGVITLSNNASFSTSIGNEIGDLFFADDFITKEDEENVEDDATNNKTFEVNLETLKSYTGKYKASSIGLVIEYKVEDDKLMAYPTGQSALSLIPTSETTFSYTGIEATIVFSIDDDGKSIGALHTQGGTDYEMEKLPPFDPSLKELKVYEGKYFSEELETFYTIVVKDSAMYAVHKNLKDIKFSPVEDDTFSGDIFFMTEAAFKRDTEGQVNAFSVSNGRTKGVLFNKQ
jgi:CubicO group peptidase (beta-lactamase class C family)